MFGIGAGELMVILALALIIVGPQKLPEVARTVGRTVNGIKAQTEELRSVISLEAAPPPATSHFPGNTSSHAYLGAVERMTAVQPELYADAPAGDHPERIETSPPAATAGE